MDELNDLLRVGAGTGQPLLEALGAAASRLPGAAVWEARLEASSSLGT